MAKTAVPTIFCGFGSLMDIDKLILAAAIGLLAAWCSGRDVGMRNAAMLQEDSDPTVVLIIREGPRPGEGKEEREEQDGAEF